MRYKVPCTPEIMNKVQIGDIITEGPSAGRIVERNIKQCYVIVIPTMVYRIERGQKDGRANRQRSGKVAKRNS